MQVETYMDAEVGVEDAIDREQASVIAERLGLNLQVRQSDSPARNPFRPMAADEAVVFGVLYPRKVEVEAWEGAIPLRVLEVLEVARGLKAETAIEGKREAGDPLFEKIEVWGPTLHDPDPILVGTIRTGAWNTQQYPLARWGEALDEWPSLRKRAAAAMKAKLKAIAARVKLDLETIDPDNLAAVTNHDPTWYSVTR